MIIIFKIHELALAIICYLTNPLVFKFVVSIHCHLTARSRSLRRLDNNDIRPRRAAIPDDDIDNERSGAACIETHGGRMYLKNRMSAAETQEPNKCGMSGRHKRLRTSPMREPKAVTRKTPRSQTDVPESYWAKMSVPDRNKDFDCEHTSTYPFCLRTCCTQK